MVSFELLKKNYDESMENDIKYNYDQLKNALDYIKNDQSKVIKLSYDNFALAYDAYISYKKGNISIYIVEEDNDFDYNGTLDEFIKENILFYDIEIVE